MTLTLICVISVVVLWHFTCFVEVILCLLDGWLCVRKRFDWLFKLYRGKNYSITHIYFCNFFLSLGSEWWKCVVKLMNWIQCQIVISFCRFWENLPCSQKSPFHPGVQPRSQTPFTALHPIQLDPHRSVQFLPNDPFKHSKENQNFSAKFLWSEKIK